MAKFVLAGRSDCPHYAKAELLAEKLQRSLPDFRVHKISILPEQWKEWLKETCKRNGWKHKHSPLAWRELVQQGGKAVLLGGFSDFLQHCQDYYDITSDMPADMMLSVAAENHQTQMSLTEEQHHARPVRPLHIWITSALSPTCHFLIPNLLSVEVFPHVSAISLHLLDLEGGEEELQGLKMETEGMAFPLLHQVTVHTDVEEAFKDADIILLLDEPDAENKEEEKKIKEVSDRYTQYGQLMDRRANREVKVIVSGGSFTNLRCSLLLENAQSIDSNHFISCAAQLQNEDRAAVAKKLNVRTADVTDVIVWGNISGSFYVDLQRAKVFNYSGAIRGPAFFSQPVLEVLHERKWVETDLQDLVSRQRAAVASKTCLAAAMTDTNGILSVLKAWNGSCGADEIFSMGVLCPGFYSLPEDIVLSVPVTFTDGQWSVLFDVNVGDDLKQKLQLFAGELMQEKELGAGKSCSS